MNTNTSTSNLLLIAMLIGASMPVTFSEETAVGAASSEGEDTPIAVDCGCKHQAPGGPGPSSGTYELSGDIGLELDFSESRNQVVLSFHTIASGGSGNEIYRVEKSDSLNRGASIWRAVWQGSAAEVEANGGMSLTMGLEEAAGFFRVVVLTIE